MDDLYRANIMDHYRNPRNFGRLKGRKITLSKENQFCGDKIGIDLRLSKDKKTIDDIRFFGTGCAIAISSASMLTEKVSGIPVGQAGNFGKGKLLKLIGINLSPTRIKCALLPLEVFRDTLALVK